MRDLFGHEPEAKKKRKDSKPNGYAWRPSTGPDGETCGSCLHCVKRGGTAGSYFKCKLTEAAWTYTRRTDILFRSAACKFWRKIMKTLINPENTTVSLNGPARIQC